MPKRAGPGYCTLLVFNQLAGGVWPESTQGTRAYRPAPEAMPQVTLFGARIRELLGQPLGTDAHGCLTPTVLDLSPQTCGEWIRFHDEVERKLGARGAFRGARGVCGRCEAALDYRGMSCKLKHTRYFSVSVRWW